MKKAKSKKKTESIFGAPTSIESGKYYWGVDGALDSVGISLFDRYTLEHLNTLSIKTYPDSEIGERVRYLRTEIEELKRKYPPYEVAMEGNFIHQFRNNANKKVFMALGGTLDALHDIVPYFYAPKTVKLSVGGDGDSSKGRIKRAVKLNNPNMKFTCDDESDAYAIITTHLIKHRGVKWKMLDDMKGITKKTKTKES